VKTKLLNGLRGIFNKIVDVTLMMENSEGQLNSLRGIFNKRDVKLMDQALPCMKALYSQGLEHSRICVDITNF